MVNTEIIPFELYNLELNRTLTAAIFLIYLCQTDKVINLLPLVNIFGFPSVVHVTERLRVSKLNENNF